MTTWRKIVMTTSLAKPAVTKVRCNARRSRRGVIAVLALVVLTVMFAFVALAVDTGLISLTKTNMQNACDAASLAASLEMSVEIAEAGQGDGGGTINRNATAVANARKMAVDVAAANGVYLNPDTDVVFGSRMFDAATNTWPINWGAEPYNVVQVTARRDHPDTAKEDGELTLSFGWALGKQSVPLTTSAAAVVQARDLVLVLDFSSSMSADSEMKSFSLLGQSNVEDSLDAMWDALVAADPQWPGNSNSNDDDDVSTSKFPASGFGEMNSYSGKYLSSNNTSKIFSNLDLDEKTDGLPTYPYPQAGRNGNGLPKNRPNFSQSKNLWYDYIRYVKDLDGPYEKRYGYRTLMEYFQVKAEGIFSTASGGGLSGWEYGLCE